MQLSATQVVTWNQTGAPAGISPQKVYIGPVVMGLPGFQVAVATASSAPSRPALRELFTTRKGQTQTQLVVAVTYGSATCLFGPDPQSQPIELPTELAQRQLQSVLAEPDALSASDRWAGFRKAHDSSGGPGFSNSGLFATHHITQNVPHRPDWSTLNQTGSGMLSARSKNLIEALGFKLRPASSGTFLLATSANDPRAIAVLLEDSENFDGKSSRFQLSPVAFGLAVAAQERVPWLVVLRKDQIRLYPGRDGVGVGSKGQSETFFEVDLSTVDAGYAGLLPLVFSADALAADGTADQLLRDSARYATELGARLRERIYEHVVPTIAVEVAQQLAKSTRLALDSEGLSTAYRVTLRILFRLLFQAYAEDRGLLPSGRNEGFDANSLKTNAARLLVSDGVDFGEASTIWRDLEQVWNAIDQGNPQWQIPAYNGGLFSTDAERSPDGALIDEVKLPDKVLGPALRHLLIDRNSDGDEGPVDFRSLSVREFGTIYEGLLESSLSLADQDLTVDNEGAWVPAKGGDPILAPAGAVYFHSASGERKATGSYFTPKVVVDHLIEHSVVPALTAHLDQIAACLLKGDAVGAAHGFFGFRVADLSMGSGHFLVAAVDKIEALMRTFLTEHAVPGVTDELLRLAQIAKDALGTDDVAKSEVDEVGLLRRQIARRCIYGLDINPMSVELARLALWIHTFVPGLPMSNLDHGLVCANSLTGVGTIDEAVDALVGTPARRLEPTVLSDDGLLGVDLVVPAPRETGYQKMVRDAVTTYLQSALPLLADVANASEANKAEIEQSSDLLAEARTKALPARRIFDAAIAKRAGRLDEAHQISRPESIEHLAGSDVPSWAIASLAPAQLPALFPEVFLRADPGFDVVLGNPPWDKVRHEPTSFWAVRDPGLNALSDEQRNARIERLRATRPVEAAEERAEEADRRELQEYFKKAFPWRGGTHLELAQLFLERALRTVRSTGEVALVLPRQFTVLAGWKNLRTELFARRDALLVQGRNKGEWLFEGVHASYAVVMLNASPLRQTPVQVGVVGSARDLRTLGPESLLEFTRDELSSMSETMAIPWFNNPGDRAVFDKMRAFPRISQPGSWVQGAHDARWDFRGTGPDNRLAVRSDAPGAWKVMMTRHADAYAMRATTVKQFIVDFQAMAAKKRGIDQDPAGDPVINADHPVVIFRHPSRSDDTRTLIATALPASGWIYNKGYVHAFAHAAGTGENEKLAVLGLLNSAIEDWWARRFVDRHVTAPVINNLPIPRLDEQSIRAIADRVAVLLDRARVGKLAGDIDVSDRAQRSSCAGLSTVELLAGIDALIARGYGLTPVDLAGLREDFTGDGYPEDVFTLTCGYLIR